jgi:hypothetical protein
MQDPLAEVGELNQQVSCLLTCHVLQTGYHLAEIFEHDQVWDRFHLQDDLKWLRHVHAHVLVDEFVSHLQLLNIIGCALRVIYKPEVSQQAVLLLEGHSCHYVLLIFRFEEHFSKIRDTLKGIELIREAMCLPKQLICDHFNIF